MLVCKSEGEVPAEDCYHFDSVKDLCFRFSKVLAVKLPRQASENEEILNHFVAPVIFPQPLGCGSSGGSPSDKSLESHDASFLSRWLICANESMTGKSRCHVFVLSLFVCFFFCSNLLSVFEGFSFQTRVFQSFMSTLAA